MADDRREFFTRDGVEAMKWGLVRAAIDRDIWDNVRAAGPMRCHTGSPEEGYRISFDHDKTLHDPELEPGYEPPKWMTHHRLPAIPGGPAENKDRMAYVEDRNGNRTSETFDVWGDAPQSGKFEFAGLYQKWFAKVDKVFTGWDEVDHIPYEKNFWEGATALRDAMRLLENLNVPGESYYTGCRSLGLVAHDPGGQGTTPPGRMWAPSINGPIDRFVIPLQGTFLNLVVVGEMLAAQLDGMGKMWQQARLGLMEIGWHATKKMSYTARFDGQALIKSAGWVVGAMGLIILPNPVSIGLAAAGLVLAGADTLLEEIEARGRDRGVVDLEAVIPSGSAEEIIRSLESALNIDRDSLESQVQIDESDSFDSLGVAFRHLKDDHTVYTGGTYRTYFTMDVSNVREDTDPDRPPDVDISVEFERLRNAGKVFADELGAELQSVSQRVRDVFPTNAAWERPEIDGRVAIGLDLFGPWENWSKVRNELAAILDLTAKQVVEVGEYLISTANYLERKDASAKDAMDKASQELDNVFK
jgi:hypothetical protein